MEIARDLSHKYNTIDNVQERKKAETIFNKLDDFFIFIKDINILSFQKLKEENYLSMLKIAGYEESVLISRVQKINQIENLEDKEWELDQFLQQHPYNLSGLYLKIDICEKRNELIKVRRYLDTIINYYPKQAYGYCEMARILFTVDKIEDAKIFLDKALSLDELSPRIHFFQSLLYFQFLPVTNLSLARTHIEKALELSPSESAYDMLYRIARKQEDYETARVSMIRLLDFNPNSKNAYKELGVLSKLSGHNHDATRYFLKEIEINPNNHEIYHVLADCLMAEERYAEAADYFARYLAHNPENDEIHHVLGTLYGQHFDNTALALFHLQKAAELNPSSKGYYNMGIIYQDKLKQYEKAETYYRRFLETNSNDADGNCRLGALLLLTEGDSIEIRTLFLQALEAQPQDYLIYKTLGILECYRLQNYQAAKQYFEKASSLNPDDGELYYQLALVTAKIEGPYQAENYLRKAESMNYTNTEVLFMLACIEIDKPLPNKGREYYLSAKDAITQSTDKNILQDIEASAELFLKEW